jgi:hypothetical protein
VAIWLIVVAAELETSSGKTLIAASSSAPRPFGLASGDAVGRRVRSSAADATDDVPTAAAPGG